MIRGVPHEQEYSGAYVDTMYQALLSPQKSLRYEATYVWTVSQFLHFQVDRPGYNYDNSFMNTGCSHTVHKGQTMWTNLMPIKTLPNLAIDQDPNNN